MIHDRATIFAVIAAYLALLVAIGIAFRRFSHDTSDYFRAGGKAAWWLVGGSMFMQSFSAWTFTGGAGGAYQAGWSLPCMLISNALVFVCFATVTGPWYRNLRCVTGADMVRLRFGRPMEQFVAYLGAATGPLYGGVQLYGLAIFTSVLLGISIDGTIVVLGLVVLFYAAVSGAWAALAADFVKAVVLMPISLLLGVLCLQKMGGLAGLLAAIHHAHLDAAYAPIKPAAVASRLAGTDPHWFTAGFMAAWFANNLINGTALTGGACPRLLCVKDGRGARKAAALAAVLFFVGLSFWFLPPMVARLTIPAEVDAMALAKPSEGAYAAMAIHLLPPALVGVVLVGMCAATMSALDAGLTSLAANITENIYPALCRLAGVVPRQGRRRLMLGRLINLFCALVIIAAALTMATFGQGGIFKILVDMLATLAPPLAVPMLLALFLRNVTPRTAFTAIGIGLACSLGIYAWPRLGGGAQVSFQAQVGSVAAVTLAVFFLVRALTAVDVETVAREAEFFGRRNRPVDFAAEIGAPNDARQLAIIGRFGIVMGIGLVLLLFPQSSRGHGGGIALIAATTLGIGLALVLAGRRLGGGVPPPGAVP